MPVKRTDCLVPLATLTVNSENPDMLSVEQSAFRTGKNWKRWFVRYQLSLTPRIVTYAQIYTLVYQSQSTPILLLFRSEFVVLLLAFFV